MRAILMARVGRRESWSSLESDGIVLIDELWMKAVYCRHGGSYNRGVYVDELFADVVSQKSWQESNRSGYVEEANIRNGSSCHSLLISVSS
jgi:hypothetical protein